MKKLLNKLSLLIFSFAVSFAFSGCDGTISGLRLIPDVSYGALNTDASLRFLDVKEAMTDLSPSFSAGTLNYNVSIGASTSTINLVVVASIGAAIEVDDVPLSTSVKPILMTEDSQIITIDVTSENGKITNQYTLTVDKIVEDDDARLSNLTVSEGSLSPEFTPGTEKYGDILQFDVDVQSSTEEIDITPTAMNSSSTITVDGATVVSGDSETVDLSGLPQGSSQDIDVVVTSPGLTTKTYRITVTKDTAPVCDDTGTNADLSNIVITMGSASYCRLYQNGFNPGDRGFNSSITSYATIVSGYSDITITASADDPCVDDITIDGVSVTPDDYGVASRTVSLTTNPTQADTIDIVVTADDGSTTKTYTILARVLNIYEFYYGIYGPPARDNKTEWYAANPDPYPGDDFWFSGSMTDSLNGGGTMHWVIEWKSFLSSVRNSMTFDYYNNGGHGYPYCEDAWEEDGIMAAEVNTSGTGYQTGTVYLYTRWGDLLAQLDLNIHLVNKSPASDSTSYTTITYMGETVVMYYLETPAKESLDAAYWTHDDPWDAGDF